ncbi:MAG: type II toxin-antitoxin system HicB family antitoxin [Campylobacter sp.]|nr:type II toxin-antitoxin system HicB family antitoxin [Campylobacter sp.]
MKFKAIIEQDENGFYGYIPALYGCTYQGVDLNDVLAGLENSAKEYLNDLPESELEHIKQKKTAVVDIEV